MAEISTELVVKLRKISGQGIMDCKRALVEANGDIEEALTILRKKGLATLSKRADRQTRQGRVVCKTDSNGKVAALVTLCCETDFVANSEDFGAAAQSAGEYALACSQDSGPENILEASLDGRKFSEILTSLAGTTGEKIEIGEYTRFRAGRAGVLGIYVHFNSKVGTMVQLEMDGENTAGQAAVQRVANDIAMHVTATKPLALDRDGIDHVTIEREKSIAAEQVKNKPAQVVEKIVAGKMNKFYEESCLVEQRFVKDDSKSVTEVLAEAAAGCGGQVRIKRFARFEIG
jgi:elongation factor Ts